MKKKAVLSQKMRNPSMFWPRKILKFLADKNKSPEGSGETCRQLSKTHWGSKDMGVPSDPVILMSTMPDRVI